MVTKPKTNSSRCFLAASLLAFGTGGCAGNLDVSEAPGAGGGSGGDGSSGTGSGGSASQSTSASNSGTGNPGTSATDGSPGSGGDGSTPCGAETCEPGEHCFAPPPDVDAEGVCAPTCDTQPNDGHGTPCLYSITGGEGVCARFLDYLPSHDVLEFRGVCSVACDPLAPDCPENFACNLTESGPLMFACLPLFRSNPVGSECSGWPMGECEPGSECIESTLCDDPTVGCDPPPDTCRAYCDVGEEDACPESQNCLRPYWFPEGSPAGYCI
jgi:hypothetical protein